MWNTLPAYLPLAHILLKNLTNRLPVIANLILRQFQDHSTMYGHKCTKSATVSGLRTDNGRSLLVSRLVTLNFTFILEVTRAHWYETDLHLLKQYHSFCTFLWLFHESEAKYDIR